MTYQVLLSRGKWNLWQIHWISESHLNQETPKRIQIPFAFYGPVSIPLQKMVFGLLITSERGKLYEIFCFGYFWWAKCPPLSASPKKSSTPLSKAPRSNSSLDAGNDEDLLPIIFNLLDWLSIFPKRPYLILCFWT